MSKRPLFLPDLCIRGFVLVGFFLVVACSAIPSTVFGQDTSENPVPTDVAAEDASLSQFQIPEVRSAVTLFLQNDLEGAELQMKRAKDKHPELPPVGVMMAKLFLNAQNLAGARMELEKAVRDDPNDPEPYVVFGNAALQQRSFTDAVLLYERALSSAENYTKNDDRKKDLSMRAYSGIATVAEIREDWPAAEQALRSLLEANPENVAALQRLARAVFEQKREPDAYTIYQDAYRIDKDNVVRPEINMARRFQASNDDTRAASLMKNAQERDPDSLATRLAIAQWALETNRLEEAKVNAKAAIEIDPDHLQVHLLDGVLARIDGDFVRAENSFRAAHLLNPAYGVGLNQLAIALAFQDDLTKRQLANQYAQMAVRLYGDPKSVLGRETLVMAGWVLYRLDRDNLAQADNYVRQAVTQGGVGEDSAFFAAQVLNEAGRTDAALQLLNRSLDDNQRLFPNRKAAMDLRAKILATPTTGTPR